MSNLQNKQYLPHGWHLARFDEFLKRVERKIILDESTQYDCVGVRWYGMGAFVRERLQGVDIARKQQWLIKTGDIVYNKLFAWKGAFAIADKQVDRCIVSDKFPTYEVDLTKINPFFLRYYFYTPDLALQAQNLSKGAAAISKLTLNPPQFWDLTIPLPPLDEQQRIVARIEELAARIEEARGLRRETVEEANILFSSVLESVFEGKNTRRWIYRKLTEKGLAKVVAGQHIMADEYNMSEDGFPYLTGPADFGSRMPEIKRWTQTPKSTAMPGDVLLTVKGAGVGKINFAPNVEVVIGRQLMAVRPNPDKLLQEFLYFFLQYRFKHFQLIATATTVPGFKKTDVEELNIPVLARNEQQDIIAYLNDVESKIVSLRQQQSETSAELDALLPSILDKAFKGEL
jgi:type I restriction enzyme S subunit